MAGAAGGGGLAQVTADAVPYALLCAACAGTAVALRPARAPRAPRTPRARARAARFITRH